MCILGRRRTRTKLGGVRFLQLVSSDLTPEQVLSTAFITNDQEVKFTGGLPSTQRNGWKNSFFVIANQKMEAEHHKLVSRMKACADGGTSLRTES